MDISVELHCEHCGSANFSLPAASDDDQIRCNDCGRDLGTPGELQSELMACAKAQSAEAMRGQVQDEAQPA